MGDVNAIYSATYSNVGFHLIAMIDNATAAHSLLGPCLRVQV